MIDEPAREDANLHWAITSAENCQQAFRERLCGGCRAQGRARCALAEYAERLIAQRYRRLSANESRAEP